jgi:hypothetical protein
MAKGTIRINSKASLERFLDTVILESVESAKRTLNEDAMQLQYEADEEKSKQERQKSAKGDVDALFGGGGDDEVEQEPKQKSSDMGDESGEELDLDSMDMGGEDIDTSDASAEAAKAITVTQDVDGIVDLLNLIRSGRSLKNAEILKQLTTWIDEMSDAEKLFTVTVLSGIKDIVTAGESAEEAEDPDDAGVSVTMQKDEDVDQTGGKKEIGEPLGQTPPPSVRVARSDGLEDTSAPIVVGRRNESFMKEYRNKIRELIGD